MNPSRSCKTIALVIVLVLVLGPGAWAQAPDEKSDEVVETNGGSVEAGDEPIKQGPNPMNVTTDVLILRPVGLIMIPVTAIVYVLGYPFAKAAGTEEDAYQALVGDTIDYTFKRPLGEGAPFE